MKDRDKIIEIESFEIGEKLKSKQLKELESTNNIKLWDIGYENKDILDFNLYVDYTRIIYFEEGKGNYNLMSLNGEIAEFKKVGKDEGSYKTIESKKKQFYLTLSTNCPKCNHNELLVDSMDNIHSTLLDLEDNFGDRYQNKNEGSGVVSKFSIQAKIEEDEFEEFFDLDLKCLKCSKVFFWYLSEVNEKEVCEKMWEAFD